MSTAFAIPSRKARIRIIQTSTTSAMTSTARIPARTIIEIWVAIRTRRFGRASAGTPGKSPGDNDRDELRGRHDAEPDRVVRQLKDEPCLGDLLHPGADERDRLS